MATIVTRAGKGAALTHQEVDANFTGLNTELGQKEVASNKGVANGYASLDAAGKVPSAQLPSYVDDVVEAANLASLPGTGETGKIYVTLDTNKTYRWSGSAYIEISASPGSTDSLAEGSTNLYFTQARARASVSASGSLSYNSSTGVFSFSDAVTSVAGRTGAVTLTSSDVGLGNVENKSSATIRGELTSSNVTTALGFTPYNATNPSGYITSSASISGSADSVRWFGRISGETGRSTHSSGVYNYSTFTAANNGGNPPTTYADVLAWGGGSAGTIQIAGDWISTTSTPLYVRSLRDCCQDWSSWTQILTSTTYNSYSPTLTGGGASGTWGISISGNSSGSNWTNYQYPTGNSNDWVQSFQQTPAHATSFREMSANGPTGTWWMVQNLRHSNANNYWGTQIAWGWEDNANNLYQRNVSGNSFSGWVRYLHSGNYSSYSPTLTGGGASGTWGISISGNAATVSSITSGQVTTALGFTPYNSTNPSGYISGNQTITVSGDASGSGATSIALTLANSGVAAGTYTKVTVDAKGRVTTGASLASSDLPTYTGTITSSQVTTALGYTPYNSTNPSGYITSSSSISGNAATATNLSTSRTNWNSNGTISAVVGQLAWKNYGNSHTIFDASLSTSPDGTSVNNTNAQVAWSATYPTLMGWNGSGTYGVRVDSARIADSAVNGLTTSNYNSYSPTLTGTGASGTWGINITGNAATATSATDSTKLPLSGGTVTGTLGTSHSPNATVYLGGIAASWGGNSYPTLYSSDVSRWVMHINPHISYVQNGTNDYTGSMTGATVRFASNTSASNYWDVGVGTNSVGADKFSIGRGGSNFFNINNDGTVQAAGNTVLNAANYNSYSPTLTGTGASGTWGINITGNAATATNGLTTSNYSSYAGGLSSTNSWSAVNYFVSNRNTTSDSPPLQAYSSNASGAIMSFHRSGYYAVNFGLDSDNVMRIGGWSAAANRWQLDMSGNGTYAGNVTAYSDERLKTDWSVIESGFVERLALMRCGTYTRIDSGHRQAGVSAQNMREILPEVVSEDNDGTLALAYGNAALVSAVELAKELVALKHKVTELEARIH